MSETVGAVPFVHEARWRLAFPESGGPKFPLVVALHGFGESGERLRERLRGLEREGFAVMYPDGPFPLEMRGEGGARIGYAWYQYTGDAAAFASALEAMAHHVDRLLDAALGDPRVDSARVALLGYSQGGYLAGAYALAHPQRLRALVAIATRIKVELFDDDRLRAARNLKVIAIHGRRDEHVPAERQREGIDRLAALGLDARLELHDGGHGLSEKLVPLIARTLR